MTLSPERFPWRSSKKQEIHRPIKVMQPKERTPLRFTPSLNDIAPTLAVETAFHFGQIFEIKVRKTNNRAEEEEEHGELGVHLLFLICFPQRPKPSPED
jgi:hypothetical protein